MKYYLTTPIYYVNAKPHIGSAYTTIAADVLARWHKKQGKDVFFLTGTAEHGTKMAQAAEQAGMTPQEFVDQNSAYFKEAWQRLGIEYTDFIRTTEERHKKAVTLFFEKLKASGQVEERDYEGLYCVGHEAFIQESELDAQGLCPDHKTKPEKIKERNWFFKLSEYQSWLTELIESDQFKIEPISRKNEVLAFINQGLKDIAISRRTVSWALPLPWDKEQTVYVWLDELFNYCSALGYGEDEVKFKKYWPADLHLMGKDIIKFHCVIWPALLKAIGEEPPRRVFAHGHFTVNGQKMSKSLGNVIDPLELVDEYGADAVRYFVLREVPFGNDGDISRERFKERYNAELANGLGNLVSRTLNMIEKFAPELSSPYEGEEAPPPAAGGEGSVAAYLESLAFDKALETIWREIAAADELIEQTKPWQLAKEEKNEEVTSVLGQLLQKLVDINAAIAPFLPETHEKLTALLAARPLKKPAVPLFARKD
jgi:methionyl-tRNA synthetase